MVGKWSLSYSNTRKDMYTITEDGSITLTSNKVTRYIETSHSHNFPSSQRWFLVKNLFRSASWEYIRLTADRVLEVHHFCNDGCENFYRGVEKNYRGRGTGCKEVLDCTGTIYLTRNIY